MKALWPLFLMAVGLPAAAHGLFVRVEVGPKETKFEAFYDDDTPASGAKLALWTKAEELVADGKMDEKGLFFHRQPLPAGEYRVAVDAGAGHYVEKKFAVPAAQAVAASGADRNPPAPAEPTRAELTQTPWAKIAIGLGAIALFALALWTTAKRRQPDA